MPRRRVAGLAGVAAAACLLLALAFGSAAGASQPPDLTGTWTPTTGGAWVLSASGTGLSHLHAEWGGIGAHAGLRGTFDGTLNALGTAYTGPFSVTEGSTQVSGTMTFTINSPTILTVTLPGSTIVMTRAGGTSPPPPTTANASISSLSGEVLVRSNGGSWRPLTPGQPLQPGDTISTGVDSKAVLSFPDGTMEVIEMTQLLVADLVNRPQRQAVMVRHKIGEVSAQVNPKKAFETDFKVSTASGTTSSRGTSSRSSTSRARARRSWG